VNNLLDILSKPEMYGSADVTTEFSKNTLFFFGFRIFQTCLLIIPTLIMLVIIQDIKFYKNKDTDYALGYKVNFINYIEYLVMSLFIFTTSLIILPIL